MSTQMNLRIDEDLKEQFQRWARKEGKTASEKMRELIDDYLQERDISGYIHNLWDRMGEQMSRRGIDNDEIQNAIEQVRQE